MIIVDRLTNYTEAQKQAFIKKYDSFDYEVIMVGSELQAWKYDDFDKAEVLKPTPIPPTPAEQLKQAKERKYNEALDGANTFLDFEATYELYNDFHIEATKENMNTFSSVAIAIEKGLLPYQEWTSKEDNVRQLNMEECLSISLGIGQIQSSVWNVQFIAYKNAIEQAETVEEVNAIVIDYGAEND